MNRKIKLLTLLIVTVLSTNILKAQASTEEITTEFFKTYEKSPEKAIENIFSTNKWVEESKEALENTKFNLTSGIKSMGNYNGYEKIVEKSVGENYKLVCFMLKYDREPIRFSFIFYRPKDKWQMQSIAFDGGLSDELEESGKVWRL
ncbi:hypothetical protein [Hyunsoonleella ulvae]|uniref:hypothetical protein n=1 Tax=Hyunsoonleella ulvae TaxID=2799948 RepID=UPI001939DE10|nr:hypothetical protein [Hyunsoonleella ulvae]